MTSATQELDQRFAQRYPKEQDALEALSQASAITSGEKERIRRLCRIEKRGLGAVLGGLKDDSRSEVIALVKSFVAYGAKAVLQAGSQRGGDFLNNQLRGQWAEHVVLSMHIDGLHLVPFGPSAAAMPGDQSHDEVVRTFREITLVEGKRPDVLAFDTATWSRFTSSDQELARTWKERLLATRDCELVRQARCGIEVKNSVWHYQRRRDSGGGSLAVTVKEEEIASITEWSTKTNCPQVFMQVFFDQIYCMSFARMLRAKSQGMVYAAGDYLADESGAGGKSYHRFFLSDDRHRCADVAFPSESLARVTVLESGNVIPHIEFLPANAAVTNAAVIREEIAYRVQDE